MQPLTPKFTNRIASYPAPVRDVLARPLEPQGARDALRVMHANANIAAAQVEALCAPGDPADVFLAKMVRSRRLMLRAGRLHWALAALAPHGARVDPGLPEADLGPMTRAEAAALVDEETEALIAPMGDPDRPYLWKLGELAAAEAEARGKASGIEPPARATLLCEVIAVWRLLRGDGLTGSGAPARAPEPGAALGRGMLVLAGGAGEAAAARAAAPLAAALEAAGLDLALRGPAGRDPAPPSPAATAYARALMAGWTPSAADRAAHATLRDHADRKGVTALAPPRPLVLEPQGGDGGEDGGWPAAARAAGLASEGGAEDAARLALPASWAPSGLLLAALRALPALAQARGEIPLEGPDPAAPRSWERAIHGHPDPAPAVPLGAFRPAPAGGLRWPGAAPGPLRIALDPPVALTGGPLEVPAAEGLAPRDAYALVLRLDAGAAPGRHVNHDRCLAVPELGRAAIEALAAQVEAGAFDAVTRTKPVVLASEDSADDPRRLIDAVGRHWAHGGRYATTDLAIDYDAREARFLPGTRAGPHLTRLIPAAAACLPLGALPGLLTAGAFDRLHLGLVLLPDDAMGVCLPPPGGGRTARALQAARLAVMRRLSPDRVDRATQAQASEAGPVTAAVAARFAGPGHWPVAALAAAATHRADRRRARLATLARDGAGMAAGELAAEGEALIAALPEDETRAARDALDAALLALAARPDALAKMSEAGLARLLALAVAAPSAPALAARLAAAAPELIGDRPELIPPLMALLATGLAPGAVEAAWTALAVALAPGDADHAPMRHRLAVMGRAHAGPEAMGRFLTFLATHVRHATGEERLLRQFAELAGPAGPGHPALAVASARAGRDLAAAIRRAADPRDLFRMAVAARDRAAALAVLADAERLADVPVRDWMDALRAYSNELAALALPVAGHVPPGGGVERVKLMATVFRDADALADLEARGFLGDGTQLSALALQVLGRPEALNAILARMAGGEDGDAGAGPIRVEGGTAAAVFRGAAAATAPAAPRAPAAAAPVAVVVSVHDPDPELLEIALGSLRAQTRPPAETFLVDDASGPAGRAAIDAALARDPALRLIRMAVNSGPYAGRNRVLEAMTADYLAIQDADDWSHPDRLARQLAAFDAVPGRQLVTAPHVRIDAGGLVQMEAGFAIAGDGPMTSLFRRSAFDRVGPFAATRSRGDVEMRERMRGYFGGHALHEIARPMMLCFAASTTLSQRVRLGRREALQLLRAHIDARPPLDALRAEGRAFDPSEVAVPHALRAPAGDAP